jgi:hypothetical protein
MCRIHAPLCLSLVMLLLLLTVKSVLRPGISVTAAVAAARGAAAHLLFTISL